MREDQDRYTPALGFAWLNSLYDPVVRLTTREATFKAELLAQAGIETNHRVLDLGCGTGTLSIAVKQKHPHAEVYGLDADHDILSRAGSKAARAKVAISFDHGMSIDLPYPDNSFDRVVSSLFFHHLTSDDKRRTCVEVRRVLKPEGELHVADWGRAQNVLMRAAFLSVQLFDGFTTTAESVGGRLVRILEETEFETVEETTRYATPLGTMALYQARKSA